MSGRIRLTRVFVLALFGSMGFFPSTGFGQEDGGEELEEIIVAGIRQSHAEALGIKRDSVNFVHAISAEDVGTLPDGNIAVFTEMINLSDEQELLFSDWTGLAAGASRPLSLGQVGRRIGFGIRASF